MHQCLGHVTPAVRAEMAFGVRQFFCGSGHTLILTQRRKDAKVKIMRG
jgi:hypothetical protein